MRDLAALILTAAERGVTGPLNAVGDHVPFGDFIAEARTAAGFEGELLSASETLADTLADERSQSLARHRKAGMAPATEARLAEELLLSR